MRGVAIHIIGEDCCYEAYDHNAGLLLWHLTGDGLDVVYDGGDGRVHVQPSFSRYL